MWVSFWIADNTIYRVTEPKWVFITTGSARRLPRLRALLFTICILHVFVSRIRLLKNLSASRMFRLFFFFSCSTLSRIARNYLGVLDSPLFLPASPPSPLRPLYRNPPFANNLPSPFCWHWCVFCSFSFLRHWHFSSLSDSKSAASAEINRTRTYTCETEGVGRLG